MSDLVLFAIVSAVMSIGVAILSAMQGSIELAFISTLFMTEAFCATSIDRARIIRTTNEALEQGETLE